MTFKNVQQEGVPLDCNSVTAEQVGAPIKKQDFIQPCPLVSDSIFFNGRGRGEAQS
jgi:hypothetical protein